MSPIRWVYNQVLRKRLIQYAPYLAALGCISKKNLEARSWMTTPQIAHCLLIDQVDPVGAAQDQGGVL
ncbi:hypothetical protein GCM10011507_13970 [Edaphobacter acidisoli]|uniref:Uncharacterized protein n=1 Tax=Edaphobacter acidisoli TaxID=2040573 RepID=A0A916W3S0_9BACT|nr:hypothetical protein GCM10011507_13970 [Edaphobacter acidisoli]